MKKMIILVCVLMLILVGCSSMNSNQTWEDDSGAQDTSDIFGCGC